MNWLNRFLPGGHLSDSQLMLLADRQATPSESARWNRHLQGCETCRAQSEGLRVLAETLRTIEVPDVPVEGLLTIRACLAAAAAEQRVREAAEICLGSRIVSRVHGSSPDQQISRLAETLLGRGSTAGLSVRGA